MAKFIDEACVYLKAGDGGSGCVSFRREKFVPRGGPNGGDGGHGANVIVVAEASLSTLLDFRYKREYEAERGGNGMGSNKHGKDGRDLLLYLPVGTLVKEAATGDIRADMISNGMRYVLLKGGRGGRGNAFFKSSTYQTPRFAQPGEKGEEDKFIFELKLLADVGIVGFPNAGKSTLISRISEAKPKIADYPFTTMVPNLGVVKFKGYTSFVVADIPGLIPGAHEGKGLGIKFLKHVERTKVLIHLIDISPQAGRNPLNDYEVIRRELSEFNADIAEMEEVVVLNKIDVFEDGSDILSLLELFSSKGLKVFGVSAITGEGVDRLVDYVGTQVVRIKDKLKENRYNSESSTLG